MTLLRSHWYFWMGYQHPRDLFHAAPYTSMKLRLSTQPVFLYSVGGITVCYGPRLQSPVSWVRSYHQDCIIFGFSFYIQNSAKILVELEIWIFKSDPSLIVDIVLNQD